MTNLLLLPEKRLPLPPFLYALVLAEGDPGHPAFTLLPPPSS